MRSRQCRTDGSWLPSVSPSSYENDACGRYYGINRRPESVLRFGQVAEHDHGHVAETEMLGGENRAWPAMISRRPPPGTGAVQPNSAIEGAILATWSAPWVLALPA